MLTAKQNEKRLLPWKRKWLGCGKIHHLDDMLKSQQRKVRQMIEQLQNSKAVIQSKDTTIQELKEKIAYLEAENLEMHDRMEHLIEKQISHGNFSTQARAKTDNPGSIRISKPPARSPCLSSEWWKPELPGDGCCHCCCLCLGEAHCPVGC